MGKRKLGFWNMINTELIPVIHMLNKEQVFANVETCLSNDIEKVFLINHSVSIYDLLVCAADVKEQYDIWVGINPLGMNVDYAIQMPLAFDGMWCDQTLDSETSVIHRKFEGQLFTGLAFKYQAQPTDLEKACIEAVVASDVAVTSGIGTGYAADVNKVRQIKEFIGHHPLAIASGVSADNVDDYKGVADYLMVASSFTDHNEMIIPDKLRALRDKLS
jgi:hypothetical protein